MSSAEPGRTRAYGADLRWRVVYQRIGMNLGFERIAKNVNIAISTAHGIYSLFQRTGNVDSAPSKERVELRQLDERAELYIIGLVLKNPKMYLGEMCHEIRKVVCVDVSPPTICRLLKKFGITRKKLSFIALQRCDVLRGAYMSQCLLFSKEMFV